MNEKPNSKKVFYKKVNATFTWLQKSFPTTFVRLNAISSPLKIGIHHDLKAYHKNTNSPLPYQDIRKALGIYVNHYRYQTALFIGNPRIDLTGNVVGEVTEDEAKAAKEKVLLLEEKREKRKSAQKQTVKQVE